MSSKIQSSSKVIGVELSNKIANMGFICACLVVLIHSPVSSTRSLVGLEYFIKSILPIIAVPVFFIISGFLLAGHMISCDRLDWWFEAIKKRFRTLLIPFWVLSILWFPIKYGVHYIGVKYFGADGSAEVMNLTLYNILSGTGILPWGQSVVVGFWYIKALFLLVLIAPLLKFAIIGSRLRAVISLFVLAIAWCFQRKFAGGGIFDFELCLRCPFFFALGIALYAYAPRKLPNRMWMVFIPMAILICWLRELHLEGDDLILRTAFICIATLVLAAAVWSIVPTAKWPKFIASNSFPVFALHGAIIYLLPVAFKALHCWKSIVNVLGPVPIALSVIIIAIITAELLKRWWPRFAGVIFGGRIAPVKVAGDKL